MASVGIDIHTQKLALLSQLSKDVSQAIIRNARRVVKEHPSVSLTRQGKFEDESRRIAELIVFQARSALNGNLL